MEIKFFGQYLLEKKIISTAQLREAMQLQSQTNASLGILAVKLGLLTKEVYQKLLDYQIKHNISFVGACKSMKLLAQEHLDRLFAKQMSNNVLLGEALARKGILTASQVDVCFKNFRSEQSETEFIILNAMTSHRYADIIGMTVQSTINLFRYLMDVQPKIGGFYQKEANGLQKESNGETLPSSGETYDWYAFQTIQGDYDFEFGIFAGNDMVLKIAGALLHRTVTDIDELSLDSAKEFVNIVSGYICTSLSVKNFKCNPDIPSILKANERKPDPRQVLIPFLLAQGTIEVRLVFHEG